MAITVVYVLAPGVAPVYLHLPRSTDDASCMAVYPSSKKLLLCLAALKNPIGFVPHYWESQVKSGKTRCINHELLHACRVTMVTIVTIATFAHDQ